MLCGGVPTPHPTPLHWYSSSCSPAHSADLTFTIKPTFCFMSWALFPGAFLHLLLSYISCSLPYPRGAAFLALLNFRIHVPLSHGVIPTTSPNKRRLPPLTANMQSLEIPTLRVS